MSPMTLPRGAHFRKHIALPQQHGSWALWIGPYLVGASVGGWLRPGLLWVSLALLGAFLMLQPMTMLVKALSGRRSREEAGVCAFWLLIYAVLAVVGALGMVATGNGVLITLGGIAAPVLFWQMWLVAHRAERRNLWAEVAGSTVLALAAPVAYWTDVGMQHVTGWWLWLWCALQSSAAIAYVFVRLERRRMTHPPTWAERWRMARFSTVWHVMNLALAASCAALGTAPALIVVPFAVVLAEAIYGGLLRPCVGAKPIAIGLRQMALTLIFAVLLILAYRSG